MFLLPVVNNPDSLFRCTRCLNKADFNIVSKIFGSFTSSVNNCHRPPVSTSKDIPR